MSSARQAIGVGCLLLVAMGATAFMALQIGALSGLGPTVDVVAPARDVAGLTTGAVVSVVGVRVGEIAAMELEHDHARVHLALDPGAKLRRGSRVRIRARSVLGEKYAELLPGPLAAPLLVDGDELPEITSQVEIDELVNSLGPLISAIDPEVVRRVGASLEGALREDPDRVARMFDDLGILLDRSARASEELPGLVTEARSTLSDGRRALSTVDASAREAQVVFVKADRLLTQLQTTSEPLPETVEEARQVLARANAALEALEGASGDLEVVLQNLSAIDREEIERLLRDEGIRVRLAGRKTKR